MSLRNLRKANTEWKIVVIDGPNVSAFTKSMGDFDGLLKGWGNDLGINVEHFHSNHEGKLLEYIHSTAPTASGYIVNPGGLARVGESLRHALKDTKRPAVEVHFANEQLSSKTIFSPSVTAIFSGMRQYSYQGALVSLTLALDDPDFLHPQGTGEFNRGHGAPRSLYT